MNCERTRNLAAEQRRIRSCCEIPGSLCSMDQLHIGESEPPPDTTADRPRRSVAGGYATSSAGTGSAVTDLIFSIAKREVTFFSATALISFL